MKKNKSLLSVVLAGFALSLGLWQQAAAQSSPSMVSIRLTNSLSTDKNRAGDKFTGTLAEPLVMSGRIVARRDAVVTGQVAEVVSSGRLSRPALITLRLRSIQSRTARYPLETAELTVKGDSHAPRNVLIIGGSAGAGAVIGGAAAGGKGAAIGALAGAGAGTLGALLSGKNEIRLPSETVLTFYVSTLTISPKELARMQPAESPLSVTRAARPGEDEDAYRTVSRRPNDDERGEYGRRSIPPSRTVVFAPYERDIVVRWFAREQGNLPPGLAKRDRLPPGLEKQMRERGTLPPGLRKTAQPLPIDLERRLRPLPSGYHRLVISGSVMIVNDQTSIICDTIYY